MTKNRNISTSDELHQRMRDAETLSAQHGLEPINWSGVAQVAFERECARRERAVAGAPSATDVDVAAIAERAHRSRSESYNAGYGAVIAAVGALDQDDIIFLADDDDSGEAYRHETGRRAIDETGYPSYEYQEWVIEREERRRGALDPLIATARAQVEGEGLSFDSDRARNGARDAFAEVGARLQDHLMAEALRGRGTDMPRA